MWDVRAVTEDEIDLFRARLSRAFGGDADEDDGARDRFLEIFEIDRTFAAFDDGDIIGTGGAFSFDLTVPGGRSVGMGGTTIVTVQPTHRRRGVLTAMMEHHLHEVASKGESVAGLWASESSIYGRFGYGRATFRCEIEMDARAVAMRGPDPLGRVRLVDAEEAEAAMRNVYEQARMDRAGMLSRTDSWWRLRRMRDDESTRGGKSARRYAIYEQNGQPLGYATYRQKEKWEDFPEGEVHVIEVITITNAAHRGLWGFLTNIDLFPTVEWWNSPIDDPLPFHVTDPRRVEREITDSLWVRLLDIPVALESRLYEQDGTLVIGVDDPFRPDNTGRYRLTVEGGEAKCQKEDGAEPDIACGVDVMGHLYLGGGDAYGMAHAGQIRGRDDAVRTVHRIFRTDRAPWCPEVF
jgi:predicted acetyltransferase